MTEINYKELYEKVQAKLNTIHTEISREVDNLTRQIDELSPKEIIFDRRALLHDIKEHNKRIAKIIDSCNSHNINDGDRDKIKEMWEFYRFIRKQIQIPINSRDAFGFTVIQKRPLIDSEVFLENYLEFKEKYKEK